MTFLFSLSDLSLSIYLEFLKTSNNLASALSKFVIIYQLIRLIKVFGIKRKLDSLPNSTLAVVFRDVKSPLKTKSERWKSYLFSTLLLLIATACLDFLSFGLIAPFFIKEKVIIVYLFLSISKLCIIIERAYEEKNQADFYIASCHLF